MTEKYQYIDDLYCLRWLKICFQRILALWLNVVMMFFYSLLLWFYMYISVMSECHHLRAKVEELCEKMELMTEEGSKLSTKSGHMVVHFI